MNASDEPVGATAYGFFLTEDSEDPEAWVLLIGHDNTDRPVLSSGKVVLYLQLASTADVLALDDDPRVRSLRLLDPQDEDYYYTMDVPKVIRILREHDRDDRGLIIEFLNLLLDVVNATQKQMPDEYRRILHSVADHLTFEKEFASFLENEGIARESVVDAICWSVGAMVLNAKLYSGDESTGA